MPTNSRVRADPEEPSARYAIVERHAESINPGNGQSRLVLSRLPRGESPIYCSTPSIKFVLQGEERYRIGNEEFVVLPGQFLVVEAGTKLVAVLSRRETTIGMCMYLSNAADMPSIGMDDPAATALGEVGRAIVLSASGTALGDYLTASARHLVTNEQSGTQCAAAMIAAASSLLETRLHDVRSQLDGLDARKHRTRFDLMRQLDIVRAWLHENKHRTVPLAELALLGGMSQFHLLRSFAAAFGLPPAAYHRKLRLDSARERLERGQIDAPDAAEAYGFSDERSLRRAFQKEFGISPRQSPRLREQLGR